MKRQNQVQYLITELENVPNRKRCKNMSELEVRKWYTENRKNLEKYLRGVKLKAEEIPNWAWYKIILLLILNAKWVNHEMQGIPNKLIWDMQDSEIRKKLKILKNDINITGDFYEMPLCEFLYVSRYCHRNI